MEGTRAFSLNEALRFPHDLGIKRPFTRSLDIAKSLLVAGIVVGAMACGTPSGRTSDDDLRNICQQIYAPNEPMPRPFVAPYRIHQPDPSFSQEVGNTNILLTDESNNAYWLAEDPESDDSYPVLSPDKKKVLFSRMESIRMIDSNRFEHDFSGKEGLYIVNVDGTDLTRVTTTEQQHVYEGFPSWSFDGKKIVFVRYDHNTQTMPSSTLYTVNPDGTNLQLLAQNTNKGTAIFSPKFSPDGNKIAFQDWDSTYVINSDGQDLKNISQGSPDGIQGSDVGFFWMPNSKELLVRTRYRLDRLRFLGKNFLVSADGGNKRDVTTLCPSEYDSFDDLVN